MPASNPLDTYPVTPRTHFRLHLLAAAYWLVHDLRRLGLPVESIFKAHPFLEAYFTEAVRLLPPDLTWEAALAWWEAAIHAWEAQSAAQSVVHLPLCGVVAQDRLLFQQRLAFMLAGLPEVDSRFGALFAQLAAPAAGRRPSLELIQRVIKAGPAQHDPEIDQVGRLLLRQGYLTLHNADDPRAEWTVSVPLALWEVAQGNAPEAGVAEPHLRLHPASVFPPLADLVLPEGHVRRLAHLAQRLTESAQAGATSPLILVLRGTAGEDFTQVAGAFAAAAGRALIEVWARHEPLSPLLGALCKMTGALPLLHTDLAPGEGFPVPVLRGDAVVIVVAMGMEGGLARGHDYPPTLSLDLPLPEVAGRARLWARALAGHVIDDLEALAATFRWSAGTIHALAPSVIATAAAEGRTLITLADVRQASRQLNRQRLDMLATFVEADGMLDQLVVGAETHGRLIELLQRCRHREGLRAHLGAGFGGSAHVGVRALFVGVSGTGKTLAARLLAAELGKDLYRVNLAAVVNKYIGETEKNLHHILSQAEALDVVLLLDEGDALLGTRTEIRSSNDRYANLETNFLLQRLEQYQGIAIVTTNAAHTIDSAFQRRMDVIARFDPPQAEERLRIWGLHLPADHQIDPIYVQHVSAQCVLTGAQIRNIVLHAALLAVDAGQPIRQGHLEAALRGEYQKAGAVFPMQAAKRNGAVMSHFLDAIGSEGRNGHG